MNLRSNDINIFKDKSKRILLFTITFVVTYFLLITAVAPKKYDLKEGDIARVDIKASRETVDEKASEEKLNEALAKVDEQYTLRVDVKNQAEANIKNLFDKLKSLNITTMEEAEKIDSIKKLEGIKVGEAESKILIQIPKEKISEIELGVTEGIQAAYEKNIEDGNQEQLLEAKKIASDKIDELNLDSSTSSMLKALVSNQIKPNFFKDKEKTEEKIKEVQKNTPKVVIKKNQTIVKEGEPVTERQIQILKDLGLLNENSGKGFLLLYLILAVFLGLILVIQNMYVYKNYKNIYSDFKKLVLINLLNVMSLVLARTVSLASPFLIPMTCAPLLITLLINYKISLFVSSVNVILIGAMVGFDPQIILLAILSNLLGATVLRKMQQRNDILYATIYISVLTAVLSFSTGIILSSNLKEILINSTFTVVGVVLAGILAIGILPFLEATFDVVTTLSLLELSNPNSPLLKKLLMEAPGTYHHSMLVANLAEMAAEEVGANPVVTRVGAYYHDIGKTTRPYFFKENQLSKENPHDKITANLSTLIIISHVKDGLELAREYKLPRVIQDIIAEHHGTTLVKYFYYTVKNNAENPDEVKEEDFRYPGPIPSSKESAILMLADSTEAAVRSINEPTKGKIEEMVNNIIKDKLNSGQLDNCDLTLKDLGKIRKCFLKALNGIYHQRIEYPTEKTRSLK
ncbi:HD family phosphohydrolase [Clostridium paraputrificum]|uniref:HD family phosphohydrolase n=1 Tax=Clostridium TaxID=1485 RepID=UPI003D340A58